MQAGIRQHEHAGYGRDDDLVVDQSLQRQDEDDAGHEEPEEAPAIVFGRPCLGASGHQFSPSIFRTPLSRPP